ncbi:MAG: diguanylate cyclase [Legionella sp.]|nr:diguanylate cyclase [Legionella sp.]
MIQEDWKCYRADYSENFETSKKTILIKKHKVNISASVGITLSLEGGLAPETLLRNADRAMYDSKKKGGDQFSLYIS